MKKKFFVGLLTLGLIGMAGTTVGAALVQPTSIGHNSSMDGILIGEATETPDNSGVFYEDESSYASSDGLLFNVNGVTPVNGGQVYPGGLAISSGDFPIGVLGYTALPEIEIDYTDGDYLTPDNKAIITIPVTNVTDEYDSSGARKYTRMNVEYVGSQYDIFNVVEKTQTTNIDPSTYDVVNNTANYSTVDYVYEITLKDGVNGYVDWNEFMTDNSEGHAPLVEDLEFNISGHENDNNGYVGGFDENFYLGDPETVDMDGAIQMDYTDSDIDLSITSDIVENVCYYESVSQDFEITNNGNSFVYMNRSAFTSDQDALVGPAGVDLSFEYNGVDLVPYWTGDEDMQEAGEWDTWQTFTINPGETVTLTISAEGLETDPGQALMASATLPYSSNLASYTTDVVAEMSYSYLDPSECGGDNNIGTAEEPTVWIDYGGTNPKNVGTIGEAGSGRFGINEYGEINYNANANGGLYVRAKNIQLDYTEGNHLTPDSKLYITIPVFNDNTNHAYDNVRVEYEASQHNIFDVVSQTPSTYIPASTGSNEHEVDYTFEVTLKDGVGRYIDEDKIEEAESEPAPLTEDMQFSISGWVDSSEIGNVSFNHTFYLGDPKTDSLEDGEGAGAIQMAYTSSSTN